MAPKLNPSQLSDFVLGKLPPSESLRVLDELERDPEASDTVDFYASLLSYARGEGRPVFEHRLNGRSSRAMAGVRGAVTYVSRRRWVFAAAAVLLLGASLGQLTRDKSLLWGDEAKRAEMGSSEQGFGVRAWADDDVMIAMSFFHEGQYDKSIRLLERILKTDPPHPSPDYLNYSLGVVHLEAAKGYRFGPVAVFDRAHARRALESLGRAAIMTTRPRLAEEANWLIAKAHLMLGERSEAIRALQMVIGLEGTRGRDARSLLILIESGE